MAVPSGGATIFFTTSSTIVAGSISIPISGTVDGVSASSTLSLKVVSTPPTSLSFTLPLFTEVELKQNASVSVQSEFISTNTNNSIYSVTLSVTGLPAGVTATVSPQVVEPNENFTVTLSAASNAPPVQNVPWTVVGTPAANVAATTSNYLLDVVSSAAGAGLNNATSYVPTRATPYAAVYDAAHQTIYSSNTLWNRVDLISDQTRTLVRSIPLREPRGLALSLDGHTVWVATGSQTIYAIDTTTLQVTNYHLPRFTSTLTGTTAWVGGSLIPLADGTLLLQGSNYDSSGVYIVAFWNPATNVLAATGAPASWGAVASSADGTQLFSFGSDENGTSFTYNVTTHSYTKAISLPGFGYAASAQANYDGSRIVVSSYGSPFAVYNNNLQLVGTLPGDGGLSGAGTFPVQDLLGGGFLLSPDGNTVYEVTQSTAIPLIVAIDLATRQIKSLSPAMPVIPVMTELSPSFLIAAPFAIDSSGMLLGIQYHGISFDDSTANMTYSSLDPGSPVFLQHAGVYSGPVAGGTTVGGFGNAFSLTPSVYFGGVSGTATLTSNDLQLVSPPFTSPSVTDVKILFPDGIEVYNPQFFTYGTVLQDAIVPGGSPNGGVAAKLDGFGLPIDPSTDTVTVGGSAATVTSKLTQYPPFTGEQTDFYLSYTSPGGAPGWADVAVKTPNGSSTLPKSFFFAKSVTDYATTDSPTFVLYDPGRNQLYLSAGDHIDVFSLTSNSFTTPLTPPALGAAKQFQGLALSHDGKSLLAADLTDYSLAVIDPDTPSTAYAVPVAKGGFTLGWSCPVGPIMVTADNLGNAYVTTGGAIGPTACAPGGYLASVNLTARTSKILNAPGCNVLGIAGYVASPANGSVIAITGGGGYGGFELYSPAANSCTPAGPALSPTDGISMSADGNVVGLASILLDGSGTVLGRFATPHIFYPSATSSSWSNYTPYQDGALQNPQLNDAASLYVWAYPNLIDFVDVQNALSRLRFGLKETVTNTVSPIAIDSGAQRVFLITNAGLTIVDLGQAPLSVGHLSQASAAAGAQIQVRGSGFATGIAATLGGVTAAALVTDPQTLTLTVPATGAGLQPLTLTNPDGTSYTLQNALSVQ